MQRAPNKYDLIASQVAEDTVATDIMTVPDCDCQPHRGYPLGDREPEYYKKAAKAVRAWAHLAIHRRLYWAVHLKGRHIVHVRNHYGISAWQGMRWMARRDYKA